MAEHARLRPSSATEQPLAQMAHRHRPQVYIHEYHPNAGVLAGFVFAACSGFAVGVLVTLWWAA